MTHGSTPRIALAHDWLVAFRGGEVVLEAIARIVRAEAAPAGLFTMFARHPAPPIGRPGRGGDDPDPGALAAFLPPTTSVLNSIPGGAGRLRRWLLPLYPIAVTDLSRKLAAAHDRRPVDLLISTSSAAIKGLRAPRGVPHLCYCHAPARYLWSQAAEYGRGRAGGLRRLGLAAFGAPLRAWDRRTAGPEHVTRFLANSTHTAAEIRRCYGRESHVVHPPVDTDHFTPGGESGDVPPPRGEHWLYAGALEPYKRVDLLIDAANRARRPLVIVGEGSQATGLRALAGPTVRFLGRVDDTELRRQYRAARLLVFPQIEDFGIVAVEAQACGTPVLAFRAGGALDSVIEGQSGAFFDEPTPEALLAAADRVPPPSVTTLEACRRSAERFSPAVFESALRRHIADLLAQATSHR